VATDDAIVSGLAPGNPAPTFTVGKSIVGRAATGSKKYSMPSLTFSFTLSTGTKKGKGYFSASVLKNSDRAIVETACFVDSGEVPQSKMDAMEAIAKQITVTEQ